MPVVPISRSVQTDGNVATNFTVRERVTLLVRFADVPVMVNVTVPVVATLLAARVNVLVPEVGFALNDAVTPLGRPVVDKLTLPLKPYWGTTVMVLVPELPCGIVRLAGEADRLKFGAPFTVSAIVVVFDRFPAVPVMITDTGPTAAVLVAVIVNVLVPGVGFVLNDAITPLGRPDAAKLTLVLKPLCGVTVIVLVPLEPWMMLTLAGAAESVKFPIGFMFTASVAVCSRLPEVPRTVTVPVPMGAVLLAVRVSVLVPVAGFGLNDAVTPLGNDVAEKVTLPVKPFSGVMERVLVPLVPCVIARLPEVERRKFGPEAGQLFTRLAALIVPIPVAKSQPIVAT